MSQMSKVCVHHIPLGLVFRPLQGGKNIFFNSQKTFYQIRAAKGLGVRYLVRGDTSLLQCTLSLCLVVLAMCTHGSEHYFF